MRLSRQSITQFRHINMTLKSSIASFRLRRKMKREKPHAWNIPSANAVYIQNYKVGTRSLRLAIGRHLLEQDGKKFSYENLDWDMLEEVDKKYSSFIKLQDIRKKWPDAFLFAFVRNPLSRLRSCYTNKIIDAKKQGSKNQFKDFGIDFDISFDDFVREVSRIPDESSDRHFRSQNWFVSIDGEVITDYLGKMESFTEDWGVLRERFGFPELPHANTSRQRGGGFREFYNRETYQLALERYHKDIEMFDYGDDV